MNLLAAFITGLATGGLSCLAVQSGLLASSLSGQIEKNVQSQKAKPHRDPRLAPPILLFLAAKLAAYTLLGGLLGQVLTLTPLMRAALLITIGVFLLGNSLRMLNVHPVFRYFVFEPPAFLTRLARRQSRKAESMTSPLFLGALSVLIPCGVTQAVMAAALGTSSAAEGAALLAAFTLGTSPVFFAVSYFALRLGKALEKNFLRFTAAVILILGLVTIDSGLNLAGSPISASKGLRSLGGFLNAPAAQTLPLPDATPASTVVANPPLASGPSAPLPTEDPSLPAGSVVTVTVKSDGYYPPSQTAPAGTPLKLRLVSEDARSCALAFVIPALNYEKLLPSNGVVSVDIPAQPSGSTLQYSCSMGMYTGEIQFN